MTNSFTNNRKSDWTYDAAGFVVHYDSAAYTRDAAGRNVQADSEASHGTYTFDGDGQALKTVLTTPGFHGGTRTTTVYYLRSIVLGLAVAELNSAGQKTKRYVYAGGRKVAEESSGGSLTWSHQEPVTGSRGDSGTTGYYSAKAEFNADGINVGLYPPESSGFDIPEPMASWVHYGLGIVCSNIDPNCTSCYLDGFEHDCGQVSHLIDIGAAQQCPNNDCGPRVAPDRNGNPVLTPLTTNPRNGQLGYWPNGPAGPGLVYDALGSPHFVSVSTDGHSEDVWQWVYDETLGKNVFVPVPTAYEGSDYFQMQPQNPAPPDRRTEAQRKCDDKLSSIFGGVVAGNGYEPTGMPNVGGAYRGGPDGHLNNAAHAYGSEDGFAEGALYIPAGGTYIGKNPYYPNSYMFYYSQLGNAKNVTLFTSHVANFSKPGGRTIGRTNIGDIGAIEGRSMTPIGVQNPSGRGTYIHANLAILK